jgi:hypothetical protein
VLVSQEDPSAPHVVATFYSVEEAELARTNLDGAGISAVLEGKHATSALPLHSMAVGGVRLVVQAKDVDAARELLAVDKSNGKGRVVEASSEDEGDAWMRRASFAAFLGVSACPGVGTAYALVLLLRYGSLSLSPRGRLHKRIAVGCCAISAVVLVLWSVGR